MKPLYSIQVLRALAALAVVLFHAFHAEGPAILGQAGVDVFFVISGFIMWLTTRREPTPGDFLLHRVVRIAPLYWIVTLLMSLYVHPSWPRVVQSLLFIPHLNRAGHVFPILGPGWTLNYEMFFYVLFAVALFFRRAVQLPVMALLLVGLVGERAFVAGTPVTDTYTSPLMLEFLFGLGLGWLWERRWGANVQAGAALALLGAAAMAASLVFTHDPGEWRVLWWGAPAALIVMGALQVEASRDLSRLKPLAILGDASYALYLVHPLVLGACERVVGRLPQPLPAIVSTAVCVVVALLVWRFVERPVGAALRRLLDRALRKPAADDRPVSSAAGPAAAPRAVPASSPAAAPQSPPR